MKILIEALRVYGWFGTVEWTAVSLAISIGLLLAVATTCLLIFAHSRKSFLALIFFTLLPPLIVFAVAALKMYVTWRSVTYLGHGMSDDYLLNETKFFFAMLTPGLVAAAPGLFLNLIGFIVKGRKHKTTAIPQTSQQLTAAPVYVSQRFAM